MSFLPKDVQDGLDRARLAQARRKSRLRVVVGEDHIPIVRMWDSGFAVPMNHAPKLRGFVDVQDGGRLMWRCLIVAASEEAGEMQYEFKRQTAVQDTAALDFVRAADAPVGLLPGR